MEGPVQDTLRDRGDELRVEAGSRHRKAQGAPTRQGMLCRGMQGNGMQHQEMGKGLSALRRLLHGFMTSICVHLKLPGPITASFFEGTTSCVRLWALTV